MPKMLHLLDKNANHSLLVNTSFCNTELTKQ